MIFGRCYRLQKHFTVVHCVFEICIAIPVKHGAPQNSC